MAENIIAIDFGTTNTYITFCQHGSKNKTPLKLGGKNPEISTALLYSDAPDADSNLYPIIGDKANKRFGTATPEEIIRKKHRYVSHFKPLIDKSDDAKRNTVDFFKGILRDSQKMNLPFFPLNHRVIIGIPSEANDVYQKTLQQLAKEAGYGDVELVHEPKGAILHDLGSNLLSLAELLAGTLVVDFGGGTCDYVYMKNGHIEHSWGDMEFGGQLFDDLFYQWFREQNPGLVQNLENDGRDFLVRAEYCRVCKEEFSEDINHGNDLIDILQIGPYGYIKNLSREDFERRARNYKPSVSLLDSWKKFNISIPKKLQAEKTDLIRWFEDSLMEGLAKREIGVNQIHIVSLAGGSSLWYFVRELCIKEFGKKNVFTNPAPYAAISEGLAILPAVQDEFARRKSEVDADHGNFITKTIGPRIIQSFDNSRDSIVNNVLSKLFDDRVVPILKEFRENGGTVNSLKERLGKDISSYQHELENDVERSLRDNMDGLHNMSFAATKTWLLGHGLQMADVNTKYHNDQISININAETPISWNTFIHILNVLIVVSIGLVAALICGGTGMALIKAGRGGLVIGFIIAVIVVVPLLFRFRKYVQKFFAKYLHIFPFILKRFVLTDYKIKKCRSKLEKKLKKEINTQKDSTLAKLKQNLGQVIQDEVDRLSVINVM